MQNFFPQFPNPHQISLDFKYKFEILTSTGIFWCFQPNRFQIIKLSEEEEKKKARYLSIYYRIMNYLQEGPVKCTSPNFN